MLIYSKDLIQLYGTPACPFNLAGKISPSITKVTERTACATSWSCQRLRLMRWASAAICDSNGQQNRSMPEAVCLSIPVIESNRMISLKTFCFILIRNTDIRTEVTLSSSLAVGMEWNTHSSGNILMHPPTPLCMCRSMI